MNTIPRAAPTEPYITETGLHWYAADFYRWECPWCGGIGKGHSRRAHVEALLAVHRRTCPKRPQEVPSG